MRRHAYFAVWALLSALIVAGCAADRIKGPRTAARDPVPLAGYPNILLDDGLDQSLVLLGDPDVKSPDGVTPMSVRVRLRSVADTPLLVTYQFRFFGAHREVLTRRPTPYTADIQPTHDRTFEAGAIDMTAANWELEVRLAR